MYHKIILVGNLGRDPEMQYTPSGQAITNFSVATSERWTDQNGDKQERTIWWRISVFGKRAESCKKFLTKGNRVLVEGQMSADPKTGSPRLWQGKDGTTNASYELRASDVRFLSPKVESDSGTSGQEASEEDGEGTIPF